MKFEMKELLGKHKLEDQKPEIQSNLIQLIARVNILLDDFKSWLMENHPTAATTATCTSGLRTDAENEAIYARKNAANKAAGRPLETVKKLSAHLFGEACDILDILHYFQEYLATERAKKIYESLDLYFEHFSATINWVHVTTRRPPSGVRFFHP